MWTLLTEFLGWLDGKKTYVVCFAYLLAVFCVKVLGIPVPGFTVGDDWANQVLIILGLAATRNAIAKK